MILATVRELNLPAEHPPLFGDGRAAERIARGLGTVDGANHLLLGVAVDDVQRRIGRNGGGLLVGDRRRIVEARGTDTEDVAGDGDTGLRQQEARERAAELGQKSGLPEEVVQQVLDSVTDPGRFADLVAGYLELKTPERQQLLETLAVFRALHATEAGYRDVSARVERLSRMQPGD
jgi:hypothetical protein